MAEEGQKRSLLERQKLARSASDLSPSVIVVPLPDDKCLVHETRIDMQVIPGRAPSPFSPVAKPFTRQGDETSLRGVVNLICRTPKYPVCPTRQWLLVPVQILAGHRGKFSEEDRHISFHSAAYA